MSRQQLQLPPQGEATTCGALLKELQSLWDEIGESEVERDEMLRQLEQECIDLYRRKVNNARNQKSELCQTLSDAEAEISRLIVLLGEKSFLGMVKKGTMREQVAMIIPALEELRFKRDARLKQFLDVQSHIFKIKEELSGNPNEKISSPLFNEEDLSEINLMELKSHLHELQMDKDRRLDEIHDCITVIKDISSVLSVDFNKELWEVHPSFVDIRSDQSKSISKDTLERLFRSIRSLTDEKRRRLKKLQVIGHNLIELWHLLEIPLQEQKKFEFVTRLISLSVDEVFIKGCLSTDVIEQAQMEVDKLNSLKSSKMKELILKKQLELEAIYNDIHIDISIEEARQSLIDAIESGDIDLSEMLSAMDDQIEKAREQAQSRKEILEKVDKWRVASEEEIWLDDYERDQNRFNAGRGAHKNLKRAEQARKLVAKLPSIVESLMSNIKVWEKERACLFLYDKERLLDILEEYTLMRHHREEEKRRSKEQRKLQEQLAAEQERLFGIRRSPLGALSGKKPLGQSSHMNANVNMNMNMSGGGCRILTPLGRHGGASAAKEKRNGGSKVSAIPVNYVALPKDDSFSPNPSHVAPSP